MAQTATPKQNHGPVPTKLADLATLIGKLPQNHEYASGAELVRAAHPETPKTLATQARGVLRDTDNGCGRGNRYGGITPKEWAQAYKQVQQAREQRRQTATAERAKAKADSKAKAAKPEPAKA